ncbi:MAG: hypothetical protein QXV73_05145 [Candidatus Micrarchaeia archaeon]
MYDYSFRLDEYYYQDPEDMFMDMIAKHFEDEIFDKELDFVPFLDENFDECPLNNDEEYWQWLFSLEPIYG